MKPITIDQLPVDAADRRLLSRTTGVHGALCVDEKVVVYGSACTLKTEAEAMAAHPSATLVWRRLGASRVAAALALMQAEGINANAAATRVGVEVSAVYRAQALRQKRGTCACCGQVLPA